MELPKRKLPSTHLISEKRKKFYTSWVEEDSQINEETKPNSVPNPNLPLNIVRKLEKVILYMYNDNKASLKLSFEQAGMLFEGEYDEEKR